MSLKRQAFDIQLLQASSATCLRELEFLGCHGAKIEWYRDEHHRMLVATIRAKLLSQKHEIKAIDHGHGWDAPASWWDHLKRDHFPAWWLKRWPVKIKSVPILSYAVTMMCPHHGTILRDDQSHIEFMTSPPKFSFLEELRCSAASASGSPSASPGSRSSGMGT